MTRILIVGGSGVFGARLARLLDTDERFELIIAGRNAVKAEHVAAALTGPAKKRGVSIDIAEIASALRRFAPDLVIHCAGPFQGQDYRVAKASIDACIPYADLSDGRAFSQGFAELDRVAKNAGAFSLTAASTTSALSTAVATSLQGQFDKIERVCVGVTPGNRAPRGRAVVEAILGYVGEPIPVRRNGRLSTTTGWGQLQRIEVAGLGPRWFSPCDAPDQVAMPLLYPDAREVSFLAGLELSVLHLPLWALAQLRHWRFIPNLSGAGGMFHQIASWFEPFGTDVGGMFVELAGMKAGKHRRLRWSLLAKSGHGPFIPAMGAAALARQLVNGRQPSPGARICAGEITLAEFEREFAAFDIQTRTETFE